MAAHGPNLYCRTDKLNQGITRHSKLGVNQPIMWIVTDYSIQAYIGNVLTNRRFDAIIMLNYLMEERRTA